MYFSTSAPSSSDKESVWIKTTSNTSLDVTGKGSRSDGERNLAHHIRGLSDAVKNGDGKHILVRQPHWVFRTFWQTQQAL